MGHGHDVSEKGRCILSYKADRNLILTAGSLSDALKRQSALSLLYHSRHLCSHLNAPGKSNKRIIDEYEVKLSGSQDVTELVQEAKILSYGYRLCQIIKNMLCGQVYNLLGQIAICSGQSRT